MNGVLLVDKPAGPTSFAVVARVRGALGGRRRVKVGHAGTLDPFATGLLLVLVGAATRLAPYLTALDKRYRTTIRLGARSDTGDRDGVIEPGDGALPDAAGLGRACRALEGEQWQRPPLASAIRVDGRRAYELHRAGQVLELEPRLVSLQAVELVDYDAIEGRAVVDVHCSKGTYVRALARDLGDALGCGAYCEELRRTAVGAFDVAAAANLDAVVDELGGPWLRTPAEAVAHLPRRQVDEAEARDLRHGMSLPTQGASGPTACLHRGSLIAIAEPDGDHLRPRLVLPEERAR